MMPACPNAHPRVTDAGSDLLRWGKKLPAELRTLVQDCWAPKANDRPDFNQICEVLEDVLSKLPADKKKKGCAIM